MKPLRQHITAFTGYCKSRSTGRFALLVFLVAMLGSCSSAPPRDPFITPEQYAAPDIDDEIVRGRIDPQAPAILVRIPGNGAVVTTPFEVEVQFEPKDGAGIDLNSLQIKYKMFNLTKKVTERMRVTKSGIRGEIDGIGPGKYKLKLSISDDRDRTAKADLSFEVVKG